MQDGKVQNSEDRGKTCCGGVEIRIFLTGVGWAFYTLVVVDATDFVKPVFQGIFESDDRIATRDDGIGGEIGVVHRREGLGGMEVVSFLIISRLEFCDMFISELVYRFGGEGVAVKLCHEIVMDVFICMWRGFGVGCRR